METPPRPKIRIKLAPRPPAPPRPEAGGRAEAATPASDSVALDFHSAVEATLRRKVREAVTANITGGLLICGLAFLAAVVTYWLAFALLSFTIGQFMTLPGWLKQIVSLGAVVFVYVYRLRHNPEELMELKVATRHDTPPFTVVWPALGLLNNVSLFAPETFRSLVRLMAAIWMISPQLMWAGVRDVQRGWRLRQMDVAACATLISMMLGKSKKVTFAEILSAYPHMDVSGVAAQLLELEGVVPLREDPPGLTLTPDFRQDFLEGCGLSV